MIRSIDFDAGPFRAGESRTIICNADAPSTIEIRCFVLEPPPPGYRPCSECGVIRGVANNQAVMVTANARLFARVGGELQIVITDAEGATQEFRVRVRPTEADAAPSASGAAMAG
jgi:molybdopterin/thiamine biosynthesis adenylyltransferase